MNPGHNCNEDGHIWRFVGYDRDGGAHYRCCYCGAESEN